MHLQFRIFVFPADCPVQWIVKRLEDALEDTLIVAENPLPEEGRPLIFLYRGKVCHSLDKVGKNAGVLSILYVVFSPDVAEEEQASVREAFFGAMDFYVMKDIFLSGPPPGRDRCVHGGIGDCSRLLFHDAGLGVLGEVWNREKFFQPPARGIAYNSLAKVRSLFRYSGLKEGRRQADGLRRSGK